MGGCATPGPLHVYSLAATGARPVFDHSDTAHLQVPSFLANGDQLRGFAYDPFTDHFFLRLAPGNRIRVVDRPARAIKREFEIAAATAVGGGDLTARPRDGHLFLLDATGGVIETTRLGKVIRTFALAGLAAPPAGLTLDPDRNRLLVLAPDGHRVTIHDLNGAHLGEFTLAQATRASLAFDSDKRELYAPLREVPGEIGVFDDTGRLLRTLAGAGDVTFVDVGPRSLIRVF